jgi:y4mF family transcriptional regulator
MQQKTNIEKIVDVLITPPPPPGGLMVLGRKHLAAEPKIITSVKDLGHQIKIVRRERKLSQEALADLSGVGRRFLSELENGKPSLEFGKVISVANAIGIDLFAKQR